MGSTALKADMDRCKTGPSLLRPSESDIHDVKESINTCWVAETFGGSHFESSLRGICIILSYASTCLWYR